MQYAPRHALLIVQLFSQTQRPIQNPGGFIL